VSGIALRPVAAGEKAALRQMLMPYFAEIAPELPDPPGRHFDGYWTQPGRWPLWVEAGGERAGFALVRATGGEHELAEFSVVPEWRRRGIGARAACAVFARFPGRWQLGVARRSPGGLSFWRRVVESCPQLHDIAEGPPLTALQSASLTFEMREAR
jgi:predicted acetyltransferase